MTPPTAENSCSIPSNGHMFLLLLLLLLLLVM
jgi:hypothetical protein